MTEPAERLSDLRRHWVKRVAAAAAAGALMGLIVAGIWQAAWQASNRSCLGQQDCFGSGVILGPAAALAGIVIMAAGSVLCFALLDARPLGLTVPAAVVLTVVELRAAASAVPGGHPPAPWLVAALTAFAMALAMTTVIRGWQQVAGAVLIVAVLIASAVVPWRLSAAIQARDLRQRFAALSFPLVAPQVPGYKIADAYPDSDTLVVNLVPDSARRDQWGAYEQIAITVTVAPASDAYVQGLLANCHPGPAVSSGGQPCRTDGPRAWFIGQPGQGEVVSRHGEVAAVASAPAGRISLHVLTEAAMTLRPTTISALR
jgi:hypothetical protein